MTNEEIKKKIEGILQEEIEYVVVCGSSVKNVCIEHIADALIAAGLTFEPMTFRIVENKPYSYTAGELANWKEDQDRIAKLLHRAARAERALENACVVILSSRNGDQPRRLRAYYKAYLEVAEKELAEEEND